MQIAAAVRVLQPLSNCSAYGALIVLDRATAGESACLHCGYGIASICERCIRFSANLGMRPTP
jgi:hypothetical protein